MTAPQAIAQRLKRWSEGAQGPMTLELYPTLRCNLDCQFCDTTDRHRPPQDELPLERHLELLEEAREMGVERVFVLGGGEPLAAREITPPLLRRVKELGMEGILTTNGTLISDALIEQFLDTGWDEIHVSLDGARPETHDLLRGRSGAFRKSVSALCRMRVRREARQLSTPRLAIHFVITRRNFRELPAMVELAHALGVFRIDFDALIAYRPEQQALALSEEDSRALPGIAQRALSLAQELGIATTLESFTSLDTRRRGEEPPPTPDAPPGELRGAPCLKAWHYLVVQADGRTSPCCVLAGEGESVRERSLRSVWEQGAFLERVRAGMLSQEPLPRCQECSANILAHEAQIRSYL